MAVAEFSPDGRVLWANDRFLALFGYRIEELLGRHHVVLCERDYTTSPDYSLFWSRLRGGACWQGEFSRVCADGRQIWISATYTPVVGPDGQVFKVVKFANDITELKVRIADFESRILALDRTHAIAEYSLDGTLTYANANFLELLGFQLDEILGLPYSQFVDGSPRDGEDHHELWARLGRGDVVTGRFRRVGNRREVWMQATYNPLFGTKGEVRGVIEFATNITSEVHLEQRNARQATTDSLTGLANRSTGVAALAHAIDRASALPDEGAAAVFIDLDEFKSVNDEFGHRVGDEVLQRAAERLDLARPPDSVLARLGGDEFLLVLGGTVDMESAHAIAEHLVSELGGPVLIDGHFAMLAGSAGVAVAQPGTFVASALLREADAAVYAAKRLGKGRVAIYDDELRRLDVEHRKVTSRLERAIDDGEVIVHYQPIVDLIAGRVMGVEALARLIDADGQFIQPASFIDIAERGHLIKRLDFSVLDHTLARFSSFTPENQGIDLAINFSRRHLNDPGFADRVLSALDRHGVPASRLTVEVTETLPLSTNPLTVRLLRSLRDAGVKVAIDDFGTGHTSVGTLRDLPVDIVKIDRSFVAALHEQRSRILFELIVRTASNLHLTTVAEGIETAEQCEIVRELGCDLAQGYLLGRPVAADDLDVTARFVGSSAVRRRAD